MFTIDLRKGAGLPPKSRPIMVGLAIVPFLVPVAGLIITGVCWQQNRTLIITQQKIISENQQKIQGFKEDLSQYQKTDEQIAFCNQKLNDVNTAIKYRIQTTPIFVELVGNLPEFLTIAKLDLERTDQQKKPSGEKNDDSKSGYLVQRKLRMTISGPAADMTDMAVRQYVQNLSESPKLSGQVQNVRLISRNNEKADNQNYSLYEIECAMKDQS